MAFNPRSEYTIVSKDINIEDRPEKEVKGSWSELQADHVILHSKGSKIVLENEELLCSYHNQSKGAKMILEQ